MTMFTMCRQIAHVKRQLAVANHLLGSTAVRAQSGNANRLRLDMVFPFDFFEVQHPQAGEIKNIDWHNGC